MVHLVFSYDANKTFLEWLEFVRDHVFEATTRAELPYDSLRTLGVQPPEIEFYFTMTSDHSDHRFGDLAISDEFYGVGTMPRKCMFEVDERKPENCRVIFDANAYDRNEMRVMRGSVSPAARGRCAWARTAAWGSASRDRRQAPAMDVRKLRGAFLLVRYSVLRLLAATEAVLETYQEMGLIGRLTVLSVLENIEGWPEKTVAYRVHRASRTQPSLLCFFISVLTIGGKSGRTRQTMAGRRSRPIRVVKSALGPNIPHRELFLSRIPLPLSGRSTDSRS